MRNLALIIVLFGLVFVAVYAHGDEADDEGNKAVEGPLKEDEENDELIDDDDDGIDEKKEDEDKKDPSPKPRPWRRRRRRRRRYYRPRCYVKCRRCCYRVCHGK